MQHRVFSLIAAPLLLAGCATLPADRAPMAGSALLESPGAVSAADLRAAEAGAEMLRRGGTATDAAIATMLAIGVVEPQSSGIGGGGFLVTGMADGKVETIDGRETAPAAANPQWFYADGKPMPFRTAVPGGRSVGVPGNLALAARAHARHGKLQWAALFEPAIKLARDGFAITPRLHSSLALFKQIAALDEGGRALFYDAAGEPLAEGTIVRNPAMAAQLEQIAQGGTARFYSGENAAAIAAKVSTSPRNPAPLTIADLAGYRAKDRPPVCGMYRAHRICSMGPPSAGGIIVIQTLGLLERFDIKSLGPLSPVSWHLIAESERLAFADRDRFVADPDFISVPAAGLVDPVYIASRSALISPTAALAKAEAGSPPGLTASFADAAPTQESGTTHFSVIDRWGDSASYTSTIEGGFGSGLVVGGYYLNNELTDFNIVPERDGKLTANRVEGGKRPRSSMSPFVVYDPSGKLRLIGGAAGGTTIPAQVIRLIIGTIDWDLTARDAISLGIVMPAAEGITVEAGTPLEAMVSALAALGHAKVTAVPMRLKANAVERIGNTLRGAADPRSEGAAVSP